MRTFVGILVAFALLVGLWIAYFAWQGRVVREYGREAVRVAGERGLAVGGGVNCAEVLGRGLPAGVERCVVRVEGGRSAAILTLEGGRVARISP